MRLVEVGHVRLCRVPEAPGDARNLRLKLYVGGGGGGEREERWHMRLCVFVCVCVCGCVCGCVDRRTILYSVVVLLKYRIKQ